MGLGLLRAATIVAAIVAEGPGSGSEAGTGPFSVDHHENDARGSRTRPLNESTKVTAWVKSGRYEHARRGVGAGPRPFFRYASERPRAYSYPEVIKQAGAGAPSSSKLQPVNNLAAMNSTHLSATNGHEGHERGLAGVLRTSRCSRSLAERSVCRFVTNGHIGHLDVLWGFFGRTGATTAGTDLPKRYTLVPGRKIATVRLIGVLPRWPVTNYPERYTGDVRWQPGGRPHLYGVGPSRTSASDSSMSGGGPSGGPTHSLKISGVGAC